MANNITDFKNNQDDLDNFKKNIYRYFSFYPFFLITISISLFIGLLYLRYTPKIYRTTTQIEIIDKAQDSEMSLPTAMTIFNRSMINLENETGVISSFEMHSRVVNALSSNIKFYTEGIVKTSENHRSEWMNDYEIKFKINPTDIKKKSTYEIEIVKNILEISEFDSEDIFVEKFQFSNLNTNSENHNLPFELKINDYKETYPKKIIKFLIFDDVTYSFVDNVKVQPVGQESDQLLIELDYPNKKISEEYLNTLVSEFDKDGIKDRQAEYKNTMDFVDARTVFLSEELGKIENKKQEFKEQNKITDIQSDAKISINQQFSYNAELFSAESQKDLVLILKDIITDNPFELMPVNIGIESSDINNLIIEYNLLIKERNSFLQSAGNNNPFVKNLEEQINKFNENIFISIDAYISSLEKIISNLENKEKEYSDFYNSIPENEKILRSIERELEVKEALFLLLLQKREEAAINFAVIKPSIKLIDSARSSKFQIKPRIIIILAISLVTGIAIPIIILFLWFYFDNRIHTRDQLSALLNDIPIIAEIPHVTTPDVLNQLISTTKRDPFAESIRMILANIKFNLNFNSDNTGNGKVILVTSSIKGEGKTLISSNLSSILSADKKVLLLGCDLRNPQIHKLLSVSKNKPGISNMLYENKANNYKDFIVKNENLDIILSGSIPSNPTKILASSKFESFLNEMKKIYDYVIIDSSPCLLVSDTFEISKYADITMYVVRSNFTKMDITNFINETHDNKRLKNLNILFNSVGNSHSYGYRYGYQYGYRYGYKYNYGYGYGYSSESK